MNVERLRDILGREEGVRLHVYDDATGRDIRPGTLVVGHPTIGVGRALDVNGLSPDEVAHLLENDVDRRALELRATLPWFDGLDEVRQEVLFLMQFQLGTGGLLRFHDALSHVKAGRYPEAAREMLDSHVARDVAPGRWQRLAHAMETGAWA